MRKGDASLPAEFFFFDAVIFYWPSFRLMRLGKRLVPHLQLSRQGQRQTCSLCRHLSTPSGINTGLPSGDC